MEYLATLVLCFLSYSFVRLFLSLTFELESTLETIDTTKSNNINSISYELQQILLASYQYIKFQLLVVLIAVDVLVLV